MQQRRKARGKLSYANVMSTLALFLVVSGGAAYAANQLAKNSVGAKQLKKAAVTTAKIKKSAVNGNKVKDASLTGKELADGTITGAKVQDGSLTPADLAPTAAPASDIIGVSLNGDCTPAAPFPSGVSASQVGTSCRVTFSSDIYNCAANATVAFRTSGLLIAAQRSVQTRRVPGVSNGIVTSPYANGAPAALPVDLTMVC